ncbi:hypothetical protein EC973_003431 [Apophysomyces ossiformis]|uniref:Uncharacterized protein n=1 Tax=Apophysomyces ossiformis TaxID=679940 RepID=A0A8H7EQM5_9FUNG|nr:hypothetical protein EC973_003431 [Apophysomyces ossiformis]
MGTWLALLIASKSKLRPQVKGIIGIGAGVDFTERWLTQEVPPIHHQDLNYVWRRPSAYAPEGYYSIPVRFLLESRNALILPDKHFHVECPVQFIHGHDDKDVPLTHVQQLRNRLIATSSTRISLEVIKHGDHRLSRPQDLLCISQRILELVKECEDSENRSSNALKAFLQ